jgi:hypothetical protein
MAAKREMCKVLVKIPEELHRLEDVAVIKYWKVLGIRDMHTGFWWGNLKERNHLKNLDVNGRI